MESNYHLILVLIYTAKSLGMESPKSLTDNAPCYPRITAVSLDKPDHRYFPYFMELCRCSGSFRGNSPNIFECVADETKDVIVTRFNMGTQKRETHTLRGKDGNHTSCKAGCTIKPEHCPKPNTYDPEKCSCTCNHDVAPAGQKIPANKNWNRRTCSFQCTKKTMCSKRFTWSKEKCSCVCKPKRRQSCTFKRGVFNEETCGCKSFSVQSSQEWDNNNGNFIGSRAFWCYALIGEFIVMLVVFDMVLFCKKSGMLYYVTRRCRPVEENENQSIAAIGDQVGDGEESCKTAFSSLRSIYIYTEQEPPISNKHDPINIV